MASIDAKFAKTPVPPYYAVIFTQKMCEKQKLEGYEKMLGRMVELVQRQPGFLGVECSQTDEDGFGITTIYFDTDENIRRWKQNAEHLEAQKLGKQQFYENYTVRVARVERDYTFSAN